MKKISKHIEVYLAQKESLFSILGRISINAVVLLCPLVYILEDYLLYFFYKWLFFLISIYHVVYGINKLLSTDLGQLGLFALVLLILTHLENFQDYLICQYFYYFLVLHVLAGVGSLFTDYALSDLKELTFFDFNLFWKFVVLLSSAYFIWFIAFWYF